LAGATVPSTVGTPTEERTAVTTSTDAPASITLIVPSLSGKIEQRSGR
jgi:hypothetical protein